MQLDRSEPPPGFEEAPSIENGAIMRKSPKFSPEVVDRAVRMVFDAKDQYPSQWAAIESIAGKIGCTAETLRKWVRQSERDSGARPGPTTVEQQRKLLLAKPSSARLDDRSFDLSRCSDLRGHFSPPAASHCARSSIPCRPG